jgi:lysozyme family protein
VAEAAPSPSRFRPCVDFVIDRIEGGAARVSDTGGDTRYGISAKAFPDEDIANLTRDRACALYLEHYWERCNCALLPAGLDLLLFDAAVNVGALEAVKLLQALLRVKADGVAGAATIGAARRFVPASELRAQFNEIRLRKYEDIVARNPAVYGRYLHGWRLRVLRVADEAGRQA